MKQKLKLSWPGYRILDRYILRKFLGTYAFAIAMITVILVVFDYAERVDNFTESHAPWSAIIFDYYINFIPDFINQFSGLFTFISVIFFTSKMAYQTEIVAMLSGGVSFRRLMWPYFLGALAIMLLSLSLNLWVIPQSQVACVKFRQTYFKKYKNEQYDRHIYRQIAPGEFVYVRGFNTSNKATYLAIERYEGTTIAATRLWRRRTYRLTPRQVAGRRSAISSVVPTRRVRKPSSSCATLIHSSTSTLRSWAVSSRLSRR